MFGTIIRPDTFSEANGVQVASGSVTVILGPYDMLRYPQKSFTLWNMGPATLSGALVQTNPDLQGSEPNTLGTQGLRTDVPNPGLWEAAPGSPALAAASSTVTIADQLQSLGVGEVRTVSFQNQSRRWWRVVGVNRGGAAITVSGWAHAVGT